MMSSKASVTNTDLKELVRWFRGFRSCAIAFSAGVDSSVLAYAAKIALECRSLAITSVSSSFPNSELIEARKMAEEIEIELEIVEQDDLSDENYFRNDVSRCYFCRNHLASVMMPIVRARGIQVWVDGTHLDDMKSPRPGVKALREAGFRAPFVELGFRKEDIRQIARQVGLSNWDRPSESCLSSRIAYGHRIDDGTLRQIERSESYVRTVTGARIVRVRTIGTSAVIEVDKQSIPATQRNLENIEVALRSWGYDSVEIDPNGYTSGKMLKLFVNDDS
jgi:pyridinium-3,5-biscarboxylic acid mononucleotide sulfurtransferase